ELEGAEYRGSGLTALAARRVMDDAAAEAQVVPAARPRQGVRELKLVAEQIRHPGLPDRERHVAAASVGRRELLRLPERDRIAIQIGESRLVQQVRADHRGVMGLRPPRA